MLDNLEIKLLSEDAIIPVRAHTTYSGIDLFSLEDYEVKPFTSKLIKTGVAINLPVNYEGSVRPKSGITTKTGLRVQYGTVEAGYTGELGVMVDNIKGHKEVIKKGQKIAQLVVSPVAYPTPLIVDEFTINGDSERGENGFGSTGLN